MPEIGIEQSLAWTGTALAPLNVRDTTNRNLRVGLYYAATELTIASAAFDGITALGNGAVALAIPALWNGTQFMTQREVNVTKTYTGAALATNTLADVWTPASGKRIRLRGFTVSGDFGAAVLVELVDEAAVIANIYFNGESVTVDYGANGHKFSAADYDLKVRHQKGANAKVAVIAWGNEE